MWMVPLAAHATPVVLTGSDYQVVLLQRGFGWLHSSIPTLTFDGTAESFVLDRSNGAVVTVNETQADLGGGDFRIGIDFFSTADIFPVLLDPSGNPTNTAYINVGLAGNPLDLAFPVELTSATIGLRNSAGTLIANADFISQVVNPLPWDGYFSGPDQASGYVNAAGRDIRELNLNLELSTVAVPEPATLALLSLGLLAVGVSRKKLSGPH